jgi:hypothetical protein
MRKWHPISKDDKTLMKEFMGAFRSILRKELVENCYTRDCIDKFVRTMSIHLGQAQGVCKVSKKAKKILGDCENVRQLDSKKRGKGIEKEHKTPVQELCQKLYDDIGKNKLNLNAWMRKCQIAFVTKEEHKRLTDLRKENPDLGSDKIYEKAKIVLEDAFTLKPELINFFV